MPPPSPWSQSFRIDGNDSGWIELAQIDAERFLLRSSIRYVGARTGLEGRVGDQAIEAIRSVSPDRLPDTDLASVPAPMLWFVNRYGLHTPAALVHDALIGADDLPEGVTERHVDRYFRFMLQDLGEPWLKRWMMWSAVALRTRLASGGAVRWFLALWILLSVLGMLGFLVALLQGSWLGLVIAGFAPFAAAGLWGRQYGAGVIAAYTAPWVGPPTLFGALSYAVYRVLVWLTERAAGPPQRA